MIHSVTSNPRHFLPTPPAFTLAVLTPLTKRAKISSAKQQLSFATGLASHLKYVSTGVSILRRHEFWFSVASALAGKALPACLSFSVGTHEIAITPANGVRRGVFLNQSARFDQCTP